MCYRATVLHAPISASGHCRLSYEIEQFLVLLVLRRYVTYRAGYRRFAQMNGAAHLLREIVARC